MAATIVAYSEPFSGVAGKAEPPVFDWFAGVRPRSQLKFIALLELLEQRGGDLEGPHVLDFGGPLRGLRCCVEDCCYVLIYAVLGPPVDVSSRTVVLLHGVTIDDPTKHGQPPPATGATSQSGLAAMLADSESGSRGSAGARTEGGVRLVPPADVRIAAARLEAFEAQPECHTHTTD